MTREEVAELKRRATGGGAAGPVATAIVELIEELAKVLETRTQSLGEAVHRLTVGFEDLVSGNVYYIRSDPLEAIRRQLTKDDCLRHVEIRRRNEAWEVIVHKDGVCGIGTGRDWQVAYDLASRDVLARATKAQANERSVPESDAGQGGAP